MFAPGMLQPCSTCCLNSVNSFCPLQIVPANLYHHTRSLRLASAARQLCVARAIVPKILPRTSHPVGLDLEALSAAGSEADAPDVELLLPDSIESDALTASTTEDENPYSPDDALSTPAEGIGGEPELELLLSEGGADLSCDRLCRMFPFPLDNFQKKSVQKFLDGKSVVVCAPTGAGKTAIAEAAAAATLARGQRVIYTTPLKALSNQKLFETRRRFGHSRCGLQTGDASLNTEADIVIMTTEILRNIMYRTAELVEENGTGQSTREARLGDVGLIVLDEVHFLGDPNRGSVWEEVIINCPKHIQLLCMSATVKNPEDLGAWITKEHQECETIQTRFRPVPLNWHFSYYKSPKGVVLTDLLDKSGKNLNPALEQKQVAPEQMQRSMGPGPAVPAWRRNAQYNSRNSRGPVPDWQLLDAGSMEAADPSIAAKRMNAKRIPQMEGVVAQLQRNSYLPVIWFILSRKDCDVNAIKASALKMTSLEETALIAAEIKALREDQPEAVREKLIPALLGGIASHHAGHLPGWKSLVERLFQRGLLKIVFATGTLAAGINMPARTTIISSLGRMTDAGPALLPHNELLQMAGRAGRRGYDTLGHCVVLQNKFEGAEEAVQILRNGPEPLTSQFSVSYGLVLNLLSIYSLQQAREFVSKSFGNFLATDGNARRLVEVAELEGRAQELMTAFKQSATSRVKELNASVKDAREQLKALRSAAVDERSRSALNALTALGLPRKVVLNWSQGEGERPLLMPAVVVGELEVPPLGPGISRDLVRGPFLACLSADNRLMRVTPVHIVGLLEGEAGSMGEEECKKVLAAAKAVKQNAWQRMEASVLTCHMSPGNAATAQVTLQLQERHAWKMIKLSDNMNQQIAAQREVVKASVSSLEAARRAITSTAQQEDAAVMEKMARAKRLLRKAERLKTELQSQLENTWKSFQDVVEILIQVDAMERDSLRILPLGLVARNIQGANELWLALALTHPAVADLDGPQLAALLGALLSADVMKKPVTVWAAYSASDAVVQVVEALEPYRQMLFEFQTDSGLTRWNDALLVDLRLAGIVEAWAAGASWQQIMEDSSLDDGDVARLLIRTIDLLKQIQHNSNLLPLLRTAAGDALKGMDRKPVAELIF